MVQERGRAICQSNHGHRLQLMHEEVQPTGRLKTMRIVQRRSRTAHEFAATESPNGCLQPPMVQKHEVDFD